MAKTKKNKYKNPVDKIEENIENISKTVDKLTSSLGPLMDFRDLGKKIEELKNLAPTKENMESMINENEGETCMHGNSWNSECSDCNSMDAFDHIIVLSDEYPNDAEFGGKVRAICNKYKEMMGDTEE